MTTVQEKLDNIDFVISDTRLQPQTYSTILQEEVFNLTFQFILRRKINILCKEGKLLKTTIPGTRGQVLLYIEPRPYKIVVEAARTGSKVYYFHTYEKVGKFYIKLEKYWQLEGVHWREGSEEKTLFAGSVLKFI